MASWNLGIRLALLVPLRCLLLFTFCISAHGDDASLKSLYDGHRWFELHDFVEKEGASASIRELSRAHSMICAGAPRSSERSSAARHGPKKQSKHTGF
jgi:hypothetical protein